MWVAIFTALICAAFAVPIWNLVKGGVLPYILKYTSDDIALEGAWKVSHVGEPSDGHNLEAHWTVKVKLKKRGHILFGEAVALCTAGEPKGNVVEYRVDGKYLNGIIDVTFCDLDDKSRNRSVFLLQVIGSGDVLEGYRLFMGRAENMVRSIPCKWVRPNSVAKCGTG